MKSYCRYAIYFAPRPGTVLAKVGKRWFSGDVAVAGLSADELGAILKGPAHYGFHGTLKAPFRLRQGCTEADLLQAVDDFARRQSAILLSALSLRRLGSFLALVPGKPCPDLDCLARTCVTALDELRASLSEEERDRRLKAGLTDRQQELLERWGYPYVFDQFRFHMTLTSALDKGAADIIEPELRKLTADALEQPVPVEDICVFGDPSDRRPFELLKRVPLGWRD